MTRAVAFLVFVFLAGAAPPVEAGFALFQIVEVYSNADGSVQYVMATGSASGQNLWAGSTLVASKESARKSFTFPADLPSAATAGRSVLMATAAFAMQTGIAPDFTIPDRFLPTDGGELDLGNADRVTLPPLPGDGVTAVDRAGAAVVNAPRNFAGATATLTARPIHAIEYFNAQLNHYFVSDLAPDIDALDSGRLPGWARTTLGFDVFPSPTASANVNPVCRILIPPPADSHFFSASPEECAATLVKFPSLLQESPHVFHVALPATEGPNAGACRVGTVPVYRVYNNRADGNHRYTTSRVVRDQMVAAGGIAEGYGADQVIMCAPVTALAVAPDQFVLRFPLSAQAEISGGVPPYAAHSSNPTLVAVAVSGSSISMVAGLAWLDTPVTVFVVDASGQVATISVILIEP